MDGLGRQLSGEEVLRGQYISRRSTRGEGRIALSFIDGSAKVAVEQVPDCGQHHPIAVLSRVGQKVTAALDPRNASTDDLSGCSSALRKEGGRHVRRVERQHNRVVRDLASTSRDF